VRLDRSTVHGLRASASRARRAPEDIIEIRCRTAAGPVPRLWEPLASKHAPQNGYAAKFSLPYLLAVILTRGRASLAEFEDDVVRAPEVLAVASRVGYELDPTIDYPRQFVGHLRVRLKDGRVVEEWQDHPRGGPDSPMPRWTPQNRPYVDGANPAIEAGTQASEL
jgi:2-methylcitrate dehydratase PrpD